MLKEQHTPANLILKKYKKNWFIFIILEIKLD